MNICIFMSSPNLQGNTNELCKPFIASLLQQGTHVRYIPLADAHIASCKGCYTCQNVQDEYGCVQKDDMQQMIGHIQWADCIVFACPIYTWYCPTELKAFLDRLFGLNKFYRSAQGSFLAKKHLALLVTHGYEKEYATTPFETGIQCLCEHSKIKYRGMYSVRDLDGLSSFQTEDAVQGAKAFARQLLLTPME